jgi:hypothetical protein
MCIRDSISAHDIVPGTKVKPYPLKNGGAIQADGTAVEFNILPARSGKEFHNNIAQALKDIEEFVDISKYAFDYSPSVCYDTDYFNYSIPSYAKELGCDPDFNAYTGVNNPLHYPDQNVRTGSGHLHIGFLGDDVVSNPKEDNHFMDCRVLTRAMDFSFLPFKYSWDTDNIRTKTYGIMGNFRPKPYGVEYRTLSNAWLNNPKMWAPMFDKVKETVVFCKTRDLLEETKRQLSSLGYCNLNNSEAFAQRVLPLLKDEQLFPFNMLGYRSAKDIKPSRF